MKLDYSNHGVSWGVDWPLCVAGLQQSPINIDTSKTTKNSKLFFDFSKYQNFNNGTLITPLGGSQIQVNDPNDISSDILFCDQQGRHLKYHLKSLNWKVPSEHTLNDRQYAAELQITHIQYATNRKLVLSILFDQNLEAIQLSKKQHLKTCFVDSFDFALFTAAVQGGQPQGMIDPPLLEFLQYIPQTDLVMYYGSMTVPNCDETVTWIVNTKPFMITQDQVSELTQVLSTQVQSQGGNYRNIQPLNGRVVYTFNNDDNIAAYQSTDAYQKTISSGAVSVFASLFSALSLLFVSIQ